MGLCLCGGGYANPGYCQPNRPRFLCGKAADFCSIDRLVRAIYESRGIQKSALLGLCFGFVFSEVGYVKREIVSVSFHSISSSFGLKTMYIH